MIYLHLGTRDPRTIWKCPGKCMLILMDMCMSLLLIRIWRYILLSDCHRALDYHLIFTPPSPILATPRQWKLVLSEELLMLAWLTPQLLTPQSLWESWESLGLPSSGNLQPWNSQVCAAVPASPGPAWAQNTASFSIRFYERSPIDNISWLE